MGSLEGAEGADGEDHLSAVHVFGLTSPTSQLDDGADDFTMRR